MAEPSADVMVFWALVRELPSRPRLSVTLHFAGERTMAEIASILDVPEGTVRSDIARARVVITAATEEPTMSTEIPGLPESELDGDDDAVFDELARRAGAALRRPAPDDGVRAIAARQRRQQALKASRCRRGRGGEL